MLQKFLKIALIFSSLSFFNYSHAEEGGSHHHPYHVAVFGGLTTVKSYTDATVGLDIERRVNPQFGIGLIGDFAVNHHAHQIAALGLFFHFAQHAKFILAPGAEFTYAHTDFLFRAGLAYDFHITDTFSIGPAVNADFIKGHATAWVYGVNFGFGF